MKILKTAFVMSRLLGDVLAFAHGEDKPGPFGGGIRMPGAFHSEAVLFYPNEVKIYLLDMNWKNPTVSDSKVEASFKGHRTSNATCQKRRTLFCVLLMGV